MARDYNINISVAGGNRRGAFGGGNLYKNKNTLNSSMYGNQQTGSQTTQYNLKRVLNMGLLFNTMQKGNEVFGAYTNNRLAQKRFNVGTTIAKYGIGLAVNPFAGGVYIASDLGYRGLMYGINVQKKNRQAEYYKQLSGNNSTSGRRYKGAYL